MEQLTPEQIEERKKQAKQAVHNSNKLVKDFKVYIAVFESGTRRQVSLLTKEEYDKMQQMKYIGSKHEDTFFKDLPEDDLWVDVKTFEITKENFALGFYPMVWKVLTLEQKVALCRVARMQTENKDFKEFCCYNSNGVVLCGKNYGGELNVGSFFREDLLGQDFLIKILNGQNTIDDSYYINKLRNGKRYEEIKDFSSIVEMQYISPLEPKTDNIEEMSPKAKAFYFDQIYRRRYRKAIQSALDLITTAAEKLEGFFPEFDKYVLEEQKTITETNLLVMKELGSNQKQRDEEYLRLKVDIFNNSFIAEYNQLAEKHNKVLEEYKNAPDAITMMDIKQELLRIQLQLEKINAKLTTFEAVREQFKDYFDAKPTYTAPTKSAKETLTPEEYSKLN